MLFHTPYTLTLLVLSALLPLFVSSAERDEWPDTVAAYERLEGAELYLEEPSEAVKQTVAKHCLTLDRKCVSFAREQPNMVLSVAPDNPEFWAAYDSVVAAKPIPVEHIDFDDLPTYSRFIEGTKGWLKRELVTRQIADARRLQEQLSAHRRRLALSNILIEKMIFLATTSILLPAVNVQMAHRGIAGIGVDERILDDMLKPLGSGELSLRHAMDGEMRLAAMQIETDSDDAGTLIELERFYGYVSDRSEATWDDYWTNGFDIHENVPGLIVDANWLPNLADYSTNIRYLDAVLHILRALREVYEGSASPGVPSQSPPAGWYWDWQRETQSLCLEPGSIHPTLNHPETICLEYLDEGLFRQLIRERIDG